MSLIKTNAIQTLAGKPILNATGSVLQVIQTLYSTEETVTSSTFANTSFALAITPSSTSSKVLALCQICLMNYANTGQSSRGNGRLYRNASNVSGIIVAGGYNYGGNGVLINHTAALNWLDSPATTSAVTYTFQMAHIDGTQTRLNYGTNSASFMILMEIAG